MSDAPSQAAAARAGEPSAASAAPSAPIEPPAGRLAPHASELPAQADHPVHPALTGLTLLERGWLSSNNLVIHAVGDEAGAVLVDTSHSNHAEQTLALLQHALGREPLVDVLNTHLHSDHCGGNAAVQREFGLAARVPGTLFEAVQAWDSARLSYDATGQHCERFEAGGVLQAGEELIAGGRRWQALAAPGHDPDSLLLFDRDRGVLLSADALWEQGFGLVFPEIQGRPGFDDVQSTLDMIERLPVTVVVPGHGRAFTDVAAAIGRARKRLAGWRADPQRHARHAVKVLLKYHLMEVRAQPEDDLLQWAEAAPMLRTVMESYGRELGLAPSALCGELLQELLASGAVTRDGARILDA